MSPSLFAQSAHMPIYPIKLTLKATEREIDFSVISQTVCAKKS